MRRAAFLCCVVCLLGAWAPARAAEPPDDASIKAAIVYNILAFVQWPEKGGRRSQFVLCVAENDPMGAGLAALDGQDLGGRPIRVRSGNPTAGACDALYLTAATATLLRQVGNGGVLTISGAHGMIEQGVMVNLVQEGRHIGFDIGAGAMHRAGLAASAKLLRLARYIRED